MYHYSHTTYFYRYLHPDKINITFLSIYTFVYNTREIPSSNDIDKFIFLGHIIDKLGIRDHPKLVWVARDSFLTPSMNGINVSFQEYIEYFMDRTTRERYDWEDRDASFQRNELSSIFKSVLARSLPSPTNSIDIIGNLDTLSDDQLYPNFISEMNHLKLLINDGIDEKIGFNGLPIDAKIESYTRAVNIPIRTPSLQVYPDNYDLVDNKLVKTSRPRTKLVVNRAALELIRDQCGNQRISVMLADKPTSPNSILRSGKSYISCLLGPRNNFQIGCSVEPDWVRSDIWMATTIPEHNGKRVLLVDTQGLEGNTNSITEMLIPSKSAIGRFKRRRSSHERCRSILKSKRSYQSNFVPKRSIPFKIIYIFDCNDHDAKKQELINLGFIYPSSIAMVDLNVEVRFKKPGCQTWISSTSIYVYPDNYDLVDNKLVKTSRPRTKLVVNRAALELIRDQCGNQRISVLSVNGLLRSGKSYLISRLLGSSNAFSLGNETEPCTHGIWIATHIPEHKGMGVILMDCEGIGSAETSTNTNHDMSIFLLSCLLSSTFVYNSLSLPNANDLDKLAVVTNLFTRLKIKEGEKIDNPQHLVNHMPHFVWVLRDFYLTPSIDKQTVTAQQYMNNLMTTNMNFLPPPEETTRNQVKQVLLTCFKSFKVKTTATPSSSGEILRTMDTTDARDLNPEFTGFNGLPIDAITFTYLVELYTIAVNDPNIIPTLESTWGSTMKIRINSTIEQAERFYKKEMIAQLTKKPLPVEYETLLNIHSGIIDQTNNIVNDSIGHLVDRVELEHIAVLVKERLYCFNNISCNVVDMLAALDLLKAEFLAESIGPAKNAVISEFEASVTKNIKQFKKLRESEKELVEKREANEMYQTKLRESDQKCKDLQVTFDNQVKEFSHTIASIQKKHEENMTQLAKDMEQQRIDYDNRIIQAEATHNTNMAAQQTGFKNEMDILSAKVVSLNSALQKAQSNTGGGGGGWFKADLTTSFHFISLSWVYKRDTTQHKVLSFFILIEERMFNLRLYLSIMVVMLSASFSRASIFATNSVDCTYNGFNLSNLTNSAAAGYQVTSNSGNIYYFNVCGLVNECVKSTQDVSVCQKGKAGGLTNFGELDQMTFTDIADGGRGVAIVYETTSGVCPNGNNRTTTVNIRCSNVTQVVGAVDGNCLPVIEMTMICPPESPKSSGIGGGWIFIIILLVSATVYILVGSIVNWKIRHHHGSDIFPNKTFWVGFGALIKDGVYYIKGKISGTPYRGYQEV
ncbi:hypothetical protein DFA_07561 [Cavenderia fasciculata]|uniref:Autophagy-related protein 27 n=1 Tax=Cavenderia fasciculata TaxID=261658 RepID=F4PWS3_CACFS|nr:uncharacterized protein DFA_07561 [Cavenderia fasciculata]EGG20437.1 hypothetical protein DFA_07561 [Cavenderia fasciculata]|eukprot:XP_004367420.1 hypothetical protein DFA_07561 [Cavenderia fasciculata]